MWLGDERRYALLSPHQLNMVVTELADNSVSISASGMTTIDYSFFGTVSFLSHITIFEVFEQFQLFRINRCLLY